MPPINKVKVELSVVLGATTMPIHQLLRMGRGAVIGLDATEDNAVTLLVNDHPVARGLVFVNGERIGVEITHIIVRDEEGRTERLDADAPARQAA